MQTWKRKSQSGRGASSGALAKPWQIHLAAVLFLLATIGAGLSSFPAPWNATVGFLRAKTGIAIPQIKPAAFRLGLDLQGGTHLVYDADMKNIAESERDTALAGVRDVIERRVNAFGVAEPLVQTTSTGGAHRLIVELAGVLDVQQAIAQIGETPVLEFKEPGETKARDATDADKKKLVELQTAEHKVAQDALARAQKGEDFAKLVAELSAEPAKRETQGNLDRFTDKSGPYAAIAKAILGAKTQIGHVVPKLIETPEGLNVVKFVGTVPGEEMDLSHILVCFKGASSCTTNMSEIEASALIDRLKKEATPKNFAELAKANSTDTSTAKEGGVIPGKVEPGQMVLPFELEARKTVVGAISNVVKTDFGYHLIYKRGSKVISTYQVQRIILPLAALSDLIPPASPWKNTALSGKHLQRAAVQFDQRSSQPYVAITFNAEGGKLFGDLTSRLVGQPIGIFLDGKPISTPVVQQAILGGDAVINGSFTLNDAKLLAQRLNAGALPVPIKLLSQQTIGPTLGLASLNKSIQAALIGFLLVALFMIVVYRLPGALAVLALLLYALVNMLAYRTFDVTITLAGIAGLVLSLGIAVDANVLIFERVKDEARLGHDLPASLREGFHRAWPPIRDGHLTTLISAIVLYNFSSSFVRGFALTLAIGVILSLFTAITIVRVYLRIVSGWKRFQSPWLYGIKRPSPIPAKAQSLKPNPL